MTDHSKSDVALKPCPFCGGKADAHTWEDFEHDDEVLAGAYCLSCDARVTREVGNTESSAIVLENCILAWNCRTTQENE